MINRLLPLLLLLFWNCGLQSQSSLNKGRVVENTFHDTIPFEFILGKMVVTLEIGDKPRKFILDTGAPCTIFEDLHQEMDAKISHNEKLTDAVGGVVHLGRIKLKSFNLGQVTFRNIPAFVLPEETNKILKCWGVAGIIGSNAFRNCILQIDLQARKLILSNELKKLDLKGHSQTPLALNWKQSNPYIEFSLGKGHRIAALFDTGDESVVCISKEDSAIPLENQVARLINVGEGKMIMSITDSQQAQWFRLFSFDTIGIGNTHLLNANSIPGEEQTDSRIGIGLGEYGIITVDYLHQQFYFQGYEGKTQIEVEQFDIAQGLNIVPKEDHYSIGMIWNNSPAARLGLKNGYKIQRFEGVDFSKRTPELDCELIMGRIYTQKDVINLEYVDEQGKIVAVSIGKE
ncbi:retropepsin-like aspartic protease [Haliscomenobacter hydrossis]|uniref:Peptidase A2 domain-containing protein n=1 Tax=Haliscomenobacter hydrossis (strain ATCC 27775 / DSM 1100 / LMG 10767 / O) TaxID=760192 RepID=F4L8F4_HALH1|nr:retropepsin-like aspartic protease [Haliscomenobacter hydrossis]AEE54662.1 hypothetical protein Halhy_6853 [Haliscomenobacter hydrossis DSM 1100]